MADDERRVCAACGERRDDAEFVRDNGRPADRCASCRASRREQTRAEAEERRRLGRRRRDQQVAAVVARIDRALRGG